MVIESLLATGIKPTGGKRQVSYMIVLLVLNCGYQGAYDWYHVRPEANYKIVLLFVCAATHHSQFLHFLRTNDKNQPNYEVRNCT